MPTRPPPTLVLTATVTPPTGVPKLKWTDPAKRLAEYAEAVRFYAALPADAAGRVVVVENSGADLSALHRAAAEVGAGDRVELLTLDPAVAMDHPATYGRGYGEFKLLDLGFAQSPTLNALPADAVVWKLTGRYRTVNFASLARTAPHAFDVYCDCKDMPARYVDLRQFAFTRAAWDGVFRGLYRGLREGVDCQWPETVVRRRIDEVRATGRWRVVPRFRREPIVNGVRGMDGVSYIDKRNAAKIALRLTCRLLARDVWI